MATDLPNDIHQTKKHLLTMISKEKLFGDFFLAAVVQDSLTYNLHQYADSPILMEVAHKAAQVSIRSAVETIGLNAFVVSESIRGVMHTMASLGGNPIAISMAVTVGGWMGIEDVIGTSTKDYSEAIAVGIAAAANDLGLDPLSFQQVTSYVTAHTANSNLVDLHTVEDCLLSNF